jgi:hypothetical protein
MTRFTNKTVDIKISAHDVFLEKEELKDIKGVIRIRKSKKNRQYNDQKEKYKRTNNDLQNIHIKLKIGYTNPTKNLG